MNSKAIAACLNDRDRVAGRAKKLEVVDAKQDFHVGISLVFMKSRKVTAYLQVRVR